MGNEEPPRLSGQSTRDIRWALEQTLGVDVVARAITSLPEDVRIAYAEAPPLGWIDYSVVVAAHEAIAREGETTMEEMLEAAVPLAVERAFRTVWRILLRFTTDAALISRTPLLYSKTRSKGTMRAHVVAPGSALCELTGWSEIPPRDLRALALSIEALLRLANRKGVRVVPTRTELGARFDVRWEA